MIVYRSNKAGFIHDVFNGEIAEKIDNAFLAHLGRHTSPNEVNSWKNSMLHMYKVVDTPEIGDDVNVAIEYQIPLTSKRIDILFSGENKENKKNVVIVELKQWESAQFSTKEGLVRTHFQFGENEVAHPSYQAWSYAYMLENYNQTVRDKNISLSPCAFLHNYKPDLVIKNQRYEEYTTKAPVFLKSDALNLRQYISDRVVKGSQEDILYYIENGKIRPSVQLADALSSMLKGNQEFIMLDEQKVVYETAMELAAEAQKKGNKKVLIVEGGPGTGKSVLAIHLLVNIINLGLAAKYVTKNAAPRAVYSQKLAKDFKRAYINHLFVGSGSFIDTKKDSFGALIVDEAHRLNMKSGMYSTDGENQIMEIINASRFSVFFVDDRQRIHIKDVGSKAYIEEIAHQQGADVYTTKLSSQFRCNGSDGYLSWLDNALQITETANIKLSPEDYDFQVFSDPNELFNKIVEKNKVNNKSRIVAGYCWDWKSKKNGYADDIVIPEYNFAKQWNFNAKVPWIMGEDSVNQIGCIHTCQGLELDYVGVILGPDIRLEGNKVVTDVTLRSSGDSSIKGFKSRMKENKVLALQDADVIIKNTYRTLMTRGMKGCYIYCVDSALAEYFKHLIDSKPAAPIATRIEPDVNDEAKYVDFLPIYEVKDASLKYVDGENVNELGWMRVDTFGKLNRNMFVVRAIGNAMEPTIKDGDYCVFRANPRGNHYNKVLLVQHNNSYDANYHGKYSIRRFNASLTQPDVIADDSDDIILTCDNPAYDSIILPPSSQDDFCVIGELVGII